jgi:hypothetical protein
MQMSRKKYRKPMMDQCRMWWTEGLVGNVEGYEWGDGGDSDQHDNQYTSQAGDGSMQNVEN